jgi:hypothetical protein
MRTNSLYENYLSLFQAQHPNSLSTSRLIHWAPFLKGLPTWILPHRGPSFQHMNPWEINHNKRLLFLTCLYFLVVVVKHTKKIKYTILITFKHIINSVASSISHCCEADLQNFIILQIRSSILRQWLSTSHWLVIDLACNPSYSGSRKQEDFN